MLKALEWMTGTCIWTGAQSVSVRKQMCCSGEAQGRVSNYFEQQLHKFTKHAEDAKEATVDGF